MKSIDAFVEGLRGIAEPGFTHENVHAYLTDNHVYYSHPCDRCLVSLEKGSYHEVPLFYDSEYGRPSGGSNAAA